ncbi:polysaccharide deacetylase family protein [Streptomyces sp. NPDC002734]|uniref:polysaccharide deacetylase family protein n=1 Tax=Streptomyces sp. NPDC002734 TaxID=3154426 RepID=UPI00332254C5
MRTSPSPAAPSQGPDARGGYVGLTFDDGPSHRTAALLEALRKAGLRATMFNQGNHATERPDLVRAQVAAGMWIANHSYSHPYMTGLEPAEMESEIVRTQQALAAAGGGTPRLFRPPYGDTDETLAAVVVKAGLTEVCWDVDTRDWDDASAEDIVEAVGRLTDGQVVLMHDWPLSTLAAIPRIGEVLRAKGLRSGMICPHTGRAVAPVDESGPDDETRAGDRAGGEARGRG